MIIYFILRPQSIAKGNNFELFERGEIEIGLIFEKTAKMESKWDGGQAAHDTRDVGLLIDGLQHRGAFPKDEVI